MQPQIVPVGDYNGKRLLNGQYLAAGEYIRSVNGSFFAIMQGDGRFCVYQGTGPADNRGFVWGSWPIGEKGGAGAYVLIMQGDGNCAVYHGSNLTDAHGILWNAGVTHDAQYLQLKLRDDGMLILAESWNGIVPDTWAYWGSQATGAVLPGYVVDQQSKNGGSYFGPIWQSFVPSINGSLAGLDLRLGLFNRSVGTQKAILRIYDGEGVAGKLMAEQRITVSAPLSDFTFYPFDLGTQTLGAGNKYTLQILPDGSKEGPSVACCSASEYPAGRCSFGPATAISFRQYVLPALPAWSHPVG
jgi:hypothetical protein